MGPHAPTDLLNEERVDYWASRTPDERFAASWVMIRAHFEARGIPFDTLKLDKSIVRLRTFAEAEEDNRREEAEGYPSLRASLSRGAMSQSNFQGTAQ